MLLPLHFSFCRTTPKNDTPGSEASGKTRSDFLISTRVPVSMRSGSRPSTVRKTGYSSSVTSISMTASSSTMIERFVRTCGQIGVITNAPDSGARIGRPAESEYAVEPVGVATIKPSALNFAATQDNVVQPRHSRILAARKFHRDVEQRPLAKNHLAGRDAFDSLRV